MSRSKLFLSLQDTISAFLSFVERDKDRFVVILTGRSQQSAVWMWSFKVLGQSVNCGRLRLKCDGTRAEIIFRLSAKRTSPFKSAWASVQSTTGSRGVRISCSNAGYTMFRRSVKSTGYPLHSPVSPSLPFSCVTVCHHISTGLYVLTTWSNRRLLTEISLVWFNIQATNCSLQ